MSEESEFEEFKKAKAMQEEEKRKHDEELRMEAMIERVVSKQKEILTKPSLNLPPISELPPLPQFMTVDKLPFEIRKKIAEQIIKEKNAAQVARGGIVVSSFAVTAAAQFNTYAPLGVAFVFMLIGGFWVMFSSKETNYLKKTYNL